MGQDILVPFFVGATFAWIEHEHDRPPLRSRVSRGQVVRVRDRRIRSTCNPINDFRWGPAVLGRARARGDQNKKERNRATHKRSLRREGKRTVTDREESWCERGESPGFANEESRAEARGHTEEGRHDEHPRISRDLSVEAGFSPPEKLVRKGGIEPP